MAILFPQPWNANFAIADRLGYVRAQLGLLAEVVLADDHGQFSSSTLSRVSRAIVGEPFQLCEFLALGSECVVFRLVDGNILKISPHQSSLPDANKFSLPTIDQGYIKTDDCEMLWFIQPYVSTPIDPAHLAVFLDALRGAGLRMIDPSPHNLGYYEGHIKILGSLVSCFFFRGSMSGILRNKCLSLPRKLQRIRNMRVAPKVCCWWLALLALTAQHICAVTRLHAQDKDFYDQVSFAPPEELLKLDPGVYQSLPGVYQLHLSGIFRIECPVSIEVDLPKLNSDTADFRKQYKIPDKIEDSYVRWVQLAKQPELYLKSASEREVYQSEKRNLGSGSCYAIDRRGILLTNRHVVSNDSAKALRQIK